MQRKLDSLADYLRVAPPLSVKLAQDDAAQGIIAGYASTFGGPPDAYNDVIAAGAFAKSLAQHALERTAPLMLWSHRPAEPIGKWLEWREDDRGLFMRGQLNLETSRGRDAYAHLKAGDVDGISIGYRVPPGGSKDGPDGTTLLTEIELLEASIVSMPANRRARVTGVKSLSEIEEILRQGGMPGRAVKKFVQGGWPALTGEELAAPDPQLATLAKRLDAATRSLKGF